MESAQGRIGRLAPWLRSLGHCRPATPDRRTHRRSDRPRRRTRHRRLRRSTRHHRSWPGTAHRHRRSIAGAALGAIISSYELLVRTETGSALWLRVESFRRFLENSEARHVEEAAEKGVLRHYTAWAVALGKPAPGPGRRSSGRRRPAGAVDDRPRPGVPSRRIVDHERSEIRLDRAVEFGRRRLLRRIRRGWRRRRRRFVVVTVTATARSGLFVASQLSPT